MNIQPPELFQLLSDQTRLRSLMLRQHEGELCVGKLNHALAFIQPKMSRHLAGLRNVGVVTGQRHGQWICYRIQPRLPPWVRDVLEVTAAAVVAEEPCCTDTRVLTAMPNRPGATCCT